MAVLGEVVTVAAGQPYADFVQANVLAPLKLADTRTDLPAALWGTRLAQGFSTRDPLPIFDARALAPAAGFSSTAEDLARFAAWVLRLRNQGGQDVLRAATVREMLRVQWTDPDAVETWGLGFAVWRDGSTALASHSGLCPGYLSHLVLGLDDDLAVVAMSNANDNRGMSRLTQPLRRLLMKGRRLPMAPAGGPPLEDFAGRYSTQPIDSEHVVLPWGKDLAALWLPVAEPATAMLVLRHVAGDTFRTVRSDGSLGESFSFQRDAGGRVVGYRRWNQTWGRVSR
jgi:Beta-lactamase